MVAHPNVGVTQLLGQDRGSTHGLARSRGSGLGQMDSGGHGAGHDPTVVIFDINVEKMYGALVHEIHAQIETGEGSMGTYIVRPEGDGPFPLVVFLMDAPGKRPLLHFMAGRIASWGFQVMLPNLYYRTTPTFELDFASRESFERMRELMSGIGNAMVGRDVGALLRHAEADERVDAKNVGVVGYCMSGPFAIWNAAEHADRVKAAASFYGVRLHVEKKDSPHLRLADVRGEIYVAAAEHDDYVPLDMVDRFEAAMQQTDVRGRVERYWGQHHGFAFSDRPQHDERSEQRHWNVLADLFGRNLLGRHIDP
jgi:carboxymethylenebutenolidase